MPKPLLVLMLILWAAPPMMAGDQQPAGNPHYGADQKRIEQVTWLQRKILKMPTLEEEQAAYVKAHRSPKVKHK